MIDLSTGIPGGYCSKLLADAGADVIKVEPPLGDALPNNNEPGVRSQAAGGRQPFDTAPYRAVVVNDLVLDADGHNIEAVCHKPE